MAASLGSLTSDIVELPELTLSGIGLNLESKKGKSNYKTILNNLEKLSSGESADKPADEPSSEGGGKKFVIRKVSISDVNVTAQIAPIGGKVTRVPITIDSIELQNVGSDSGGVLMSELTGVIVQAILTAVVKSGGDQLPAAIAGELSNSLAALGDLGGATLAIAGQVTEALSESVDQLGKDATAAVQDATKELSKTADGVSEGLGKSVEDAGKELEKSIGGLFGKKKEDKKKKDDSTGGG